jgi:hypothetical protein
MVEVLVVEGHVGEAFIDVDLDALWCMLDGCLGELAVIGAGAQAATTRARIRVLITAALRPLSAPEVGRRSSGGSSSISRRLQRTGP